MKWWTTLVAAVVVSAVGSLYAAKTIPLAGEWRFEIAGTNQQPFARELPGKIRLPGTMDDAGLGPKNTKPPTLDGPYRLYDYAGPAWYQRDIEIPAAWDGKRVTLFLERCRWVTTVWLDDQLIGTQDSLIAPHVYDFGTGVDAGQAPADDLRGQHRQDQPRQIRLGAVRRHVGQHERHRRPHRTGRHAAGVDRRRAGVSERGEEDGAREGADRQRHRQGRDSGTLSVGAKSIEATWDAERRPAPKSKWT